MSISRNLVSVFFLIFALISYSEFGYSKDISDSETQKNEYYDALIDSVDACIARQAWSEATVFIKNALEARPASFNNALLLSNLGVAYTALEQYDEALKAFEIGLAISPSSIVLYSNRARTLMEMGRNAQALTDLSAALNIDPSLTWERKMRGILAILQGNLNSGLEDIDKYLEYSPNDVDARAILAESLINSGDRTAGFKEYEKCLDSAPCDPVIAFNYAAALIDVQNYSKALEILSNAIKISPRDGDLFLLRSHLYKLLHRNNDAANDRKIAIENGADPELLNQIK